MRDEETLTNTALEKGHKQKEPGLLQAHRKPWIQFGYFVFVLMVLSIIFSLIKVMAD